MADTRNSVVENINFGSNKLSEIIVKQFFGKVLDIYFLCHKNYMTFGFF